ncbi:MarR family winged helix-turn-helix transcriptional regulator [Oerskovia flava]|uniref:MarR family winged helix-turn-helix transcriptional regulator n=1 Tax=Oerskovia flava TaxID=2986422 RepID=UPI00224019E6|nr:MarR family winged helix-turn-helix transcriptional regulator [Oerskovia sp. JB1-3-2]
MDIESAPARLRELPSWLINQAALDASRRVTDELSTVGAHRSHFALLAALDEFGPGSQADLGRRCGIDRSDMVALVDRLAAEGYVERRDDPADRRRNLVILMPEGRQRLAALESVLAAAQDHLLEPLSETERERLTALLTMLVTRRPTSLTVDG